MILTSASWISLTLTVCAALAYAILAGGAKHLSARISRRALWVALLLHALLLSWGLFGPSPRCGFAPALSVTAWRVTAVYAVESHVYPQIQTRWALCGLGTLTVVLALLFPGTELHSHASPWVPLHWALGIASYGLFAAAVLHAWFMTRTEQQIRLAADPHSGMPLLTIERQTFRFVTAGFILLSGTLLVAWVFSGLLKGNGLLWKWDHKTIFSLLAWLSFAILLVGRWRFGWRGRYATRVLYVGASFLLLAYVGSRFVLEIMLGRAP